MRIIILFLLNLFVLHVKAETRLHENVGDVQMYQEVMPQFGKDGKPLVNQLPLEDYRAYGCRSEAFFPYIFRSHVIGLEGESITHEWHREGKLEYFETLNITQQRQSVESRYTIHRYRAGKWAVHVINQKKEIMASYHFQFSGCPAKSRSW